MARKHLFEIANTDPAPAEVQQPQPRQLERPLLGLNLTPSTPVGAISQSLEAINSRATRAEERSEEHTSELQSRENLVCRLLLEKKKKKKLIQIKHQRICLERLVTEYLTLVIRTSQFLFESNLVGRPHMSISVHEVTTRFI